VATAENPQVKRLPFWRFPSLACACAAIGGAAVTFVVTPARAQDDLDIQAQMGRHRQFASPQNFAAEIRISPFKPNVDDDPSLNGATPYKTVFGDSPRVMFGAEFDWQALRIPHLGTLGPGVSAAFVSISDPASFQDGSGPSAETTTLSIFPFVAMAVFRLDEFWREAHVPFVPYAKLGLEYALWRASNTLGTSNYNGVTGTGHSLGTHLAIGLAFNLDIFDSYAAQNIDDQLGINSTYIFAEVQRDDTNGLGIQSNALRVGGTNWAFGFAFEF
jgi:hypothetical protein